MEDDLNTLIAILKSENQALEEDRLADVKVLLPQKEASAALVARTGTLMQSADASLQRSLDQLDDLASRNALLLKKKIDIQKNLIRLLADASFTEGPALYGRNGNRTEVKSGISLILNLEQ
ncbi:hypothetical protein AA101099_1994 [Neoasaia chiangmaiensis NBRC 101099]|uniref:Uncharacterized protein n=1 Tax=Neoasaia chiangmaiensis TaxID=320497 RepID=A0A1U9KT42_9PROT|nr:hypothetical protein [Neoasaia chiangmaiensis]AQS88998.1 hypothetical protein A0U93_14935 [Neoasaia chiangmaiensis]GBR40180.1 hypothetical protein AA101099_1994 [Neoasaia chiangmaiensis NBRC 101099]GEN14021.1 hypothetical protein NCH01_04520 [Neoasaia chiangmaiensis]